MRYATLLLLLTFLGCSDLFGPDVQYTNRRPLAPPPSYAIWYAEVEACLGKTGDFGAVRWFVADNIRRNGENVAAVLVFPSDVTLKPAYATLSWAVKHEMIHHVLQAGDEIHGLYSGCQLH